MSSHFEVENWLNFYQVESSHFSINKSISSRFQVILGQVSWAETNDTQPITSIGWWQLYQQPPQPATPQGPKTSQNLQNRRTRILGPLTPATEHAHRLPTYQRHGKGIWCTRNCWLREKRNNENLDESWATAGKARKVGTMSKYLANEL